MHKSSVIAACAASLFTLVIISGLSLLTGAPQLIAAPNLLWSADHEDRTMNAWRANGCGGEFNSDGGTSDVSKDVAYAGQWSAKMVLPNASTQVQGVRLFRWCEAQQNQELYYSAWYYFPQRYTSGNWWTIMQWKSNGSYNAKFQVTVGNRSDGQMYVYLGRGTDSGGGAWHQNIANLPVGKWVHLEVYVKKATDTTGRVTLWQDGVQLIDLPGVQTANSSDLSWAVINYGERINPSTVTVYADNAAISRTRLGP